MVPTLGQQEMDLVRFLSECPNPLTTREIAELYGEPRGLARTTTSTMLERLRKKNYLIRTENDGTYRYSSRVSKVELLQDAIRNFIEQTLGGSLSPFVTYLTQETDLSEADIRKFKRIIEDLDQHRAKRKDD